MRNNPSPEPTLFSAPLLPGSTSWVQQYFRMSRILTFPVLILVLVLIVVFWESIPGVWAAIVLIGVPANFLLFHYLFARVFAQIEMNKWHTHIMTATDNTLTLLVPGREAESYRFQRMEKLRIFFSGYEKAWFPSGKHFSGSRNKLSFKYGEKKVELTFRLISQSHYSELLHFVSVLYENGIHFEEFNSTSGLPVKSHLLVIEAGNGDD